MLIPLLTGISALALVFNSPFFSDEKRKSITGKITRAEHGKIVIDDGKKLTAAEVTSETVCYLNERTVAVDDLCEGRKATLKFEERKGRAIAKVVDLFPTADDFRSEAES